MRFPYTRRRPCPTQARGPAQASCDREGARTTDRREKCGWAPGRARRPLHQTLFHCQALRPSALHSSSAGQPWGSAPTAKGRSLPRRARLGLRPVGPTTTRRAVSRQFKRGDLQVTCQRVGGVAPGSGLSAREIAATAAAAPSQTPYIRCCSTGFTLAAAPGPPAAGAAPAMGEEDYYLELCDRPVHFEKANPVNCVFFDEANKQVRAGPRPSPPRGPARPASRPRGCRVFRASGPGVRGSGLGPPRQSGPVRHPSDRAPPRPGLPPPK